MGNLHLVTGSRGEKHITSADHGSFNAAIFGAGNYVLNRGSKFATTTITNNQIRVADGDLLIQGRHVRLNENTYVDLTIENGAQGYYRNDLIVARYTKDGTSGVEDCNLVVIKGTATTGTAADPEYTTGDIINDHVLIADMPLYRVPLDGLNVQELVPLFEEASLMPDGSVTTSKVANGAITSAKIAPGAVSQTFTATVPASGWAQSSGYATQTITMSGLLTTDTFFIDLNMPQTGNVTTQQDYLEAWATIGKAQCITNGQLRLTVFGTAPTADFPVKVVAIRK